MALEAVTGLNGIAKWRGSIIKSLPSIKGGIKVIPTFHPSYIMKMYRSSALVLFDLAKILNESKQTEARTLLNVLVSQTHLLMRLAYHLLKEDHQSGVSLKSVCYGIKSVTFLQIKISKK